MAISSHADLVQIKPTAIRNLANDILSRHQQSTSNSTFAIEWDEEGWHYLPSPELPPVIAMERLALYIVAMDAINFCFWPTHSTTTSTTLREKPTSTNFEYEHLAMAMATMAKLDEDDQLAHPTVLSPAYIFAPDRLANMTLVEMNHLWMQHLDQLAKDKNCPPITTLDNMETRCQLWNEVGSVIKKKWNGNILDFLGIPAPASTASLLKSNLSAPELVDRILEYFPGFRDCCAWSSESTNDHTDHKYLCLYKRAQICVGDLNASLKLKLKGLDQVTTFADYRVPQFLRHAGVLEYETSLGTAINNGREIPVNSEEEKTIRASTVVAVEELVQELRSLQQHLHTNGNTSDNTDEPIFTAVSVDWYLWQLGEKMHHEGALECHHKTRTTFY